MKYIIIIILCALSALQVKGQNPVGDNLFASGIELQKKKTVASQRQAIEKFKSAKVAYDSVDKKNACDQAIARSNSIIKSLSTSTKGKKQKVAEKIIEPTLAVSCAKLIFEHKSKPGLVKVLTNQKNWNVKILSKTSDFASIRTTENNDEIEVNCVDNTGLKTRTMVLEVTAGELKKQITIEQKGVPTNFYAHDTMIKFSKKGDTKATILYSNYTETYSDNNGKNWRVVSKPEWVNIVSGEKKSKNLLSKISDAVTGNRIEDETASDVIKSAANIAVLPISKKSPEYDEGRNGTIVLQSGNKEISIVIIQM